MSGIYHVIGKPRAGKTSFVVAKVLNEEMQPFNDNYFNCIKYIRDENRRKNKNRELPPQRHVVSADFDIIQHFPTMQSYKCSGWEFGCSNPVCYTKPFLPYGTYVFDEAQRYFDSKGDQKLPPWVSRAFELHGHKFLTIYLITQRQVRLHTDIRTIAKATIYIESSVHTYIINGKKVKASEYLKEGQLIKTEWFGREFEDGDEVDDYIKKRGNYKHLGKPFKYTFIGDIREHYDPYGFADELDDLSRDYNYYEYVVNKRPKEWTDYKKKFEEIEKQKQEIANKLNKKEAA